MEDFGPKEEVGECGSYKSVRFSSFSLGIEGQKRVLRVFEILINISTIITEIEGFIIKNTKRGGIPS